MVYCDGHRTDGGIIHNEGGRKKLLPFTDIPPPPMHLQSGGASVLPTIPGGSIPNSSLKVLEKILPSQ